MKPSGTAGVEGNAKRRHTSWRRAQAHAAGSGVDVAPVILGLLADRDDGQLISDF
jgi:hypothetical protein